LNAYDKFVTVGIEMWNCCGTLLWRFGLTVHWGYDVNAVTFVSPTSANNTYSGWYEYSRPAPTWYWVSYPRVAEAHGEAVNRCCWGANWEQDNPHVWIGVNADGNWNSRTACYC